MLNNCFLWEAPSMKLLEVDGIDDLWDVVKIDCTENCVILNVL